jgi:hypothetical protein
VNELMQELVKREVEARAAEDAGRQWQLPPAWHANLPVPQDMQAVSPGMLHTLGGLADAASTYAFTKRGTGRESNPALNFTKGNPEATGLAALGGLAVSKGATALLRKLSPKLADAVSANLGAQQLGMAVNNLDDRRSLSSFNRYGQAMAHNAIRESGKR